MQHAKNFICNISFNCPPNLRDKHFLYILKMEKLNFRESKSEEMIITLKLSESIFSSYLKIEIILFKITVLFTLKYQLLRSRSMKRIDPVFFF